MTDDESMFLNVDFFVMTDIKSANECACSASVREGINIMLALHKLVKGFRRWIESSPCYNDFGFPGSIGDLEEVQHRRDVDDELKYTRTRRTSQYEIRYPGVHSGCSGRGIVRF